MIANATSNADSTPGSGDDSAPRSLSEKARGKLPARASSIDSGLGNLGAGMTVGAESAILGYESAGGFVATEEWVQSWVQGLPLDSLLVTITEVSQGISCYKLGLGANLSFFLYSFSRKSKR